MILIESVTPAAPKLLVRAWDRSTDADYDSFSVPVGKSQQNNISR